MPELPEVETTRRGIETHLEGQRVDQVIVRETRLRWPIPTQQLQQDMLGQTFIKIERRAKYLLLQTTSGTLIIHLGMSGRLRLNPVGNPLQKHDHFDLVLSNKKVLRYTDPRRFGAILWTREDPLTHPLLNKLGPEPLSSDFNAEYLFEQSRKRPITIKQFLMDNKVVVGVGNIYANEALFAAGIHPLYSSKLLNLSQCAALVKAIKTILAKAIEAGGTTLKDFISADGKPGYFQQELLVYGRENLACMHCATLLTKIVIGQRATVYCKLCQKL